MLMNQVPDSWNPHQRLEFLKVSIRSVMSEQVRRKRKEIEVDIESKVESLNDMEELKLKILCRNDLTQREWRDRNQWTRQ
jgi:hypothetical protein